MIRIAPYYLITALSLPLIGCSEKPGNLNEGKTVIAPLPSSSAAALPGVKTALWEDVFQQITRETRPVVLDVWSLGCQPCLKEFPGLVRLHDQMGNQVACFSIDVDYDGRKTKPPETYRKEIEAFLHNVDAIGKFPHFISATPSDPLFNKLGIRSIPCVIVFAPDGKIMKRFMDVGDTIGFTYDKDVIPYLRSMIDLPETGSSNDSVESK